MHSQASVPGGGGYSPSCIKYALNAMLMQYARALNIEKNTYFIRVIVKNNNLTSFGYYLLGK